MAEITTISISKKDKEIIEEYSLSPSAIVQDYVRRFEEGRKELKKENEELRATIKNLNQWMSALSTLLQEKGMEWRDISAYVEKWRQANNGAN